jgi:hypothetical protein
MPDRIVRAVILTSESVNKLSWAAEVFYRRLFSIVDDYGRYDARATLLRAHLYPLKIDRVSDVDVGKWLTECVTAALVNVYQVSNQPYLEIAKFGQRVRADKSKFPPPPTSADICQQALSDAPVFVSVVVSEDVVDKEKPARKRADAHPCPEDVDSQVWADWLSLRKAKRAVVSETVIEEARKESVKAGMPLEEFLRIWCVRGSQGLQADWLKPNERQQAQHKSFRESDAQAKRDEVSQWTGGILGSSSDLNTIDMEALHGSLTAID